MHSITFQLVVWWNTFLEPQIYAIHYMIGFLTLTIISDHELRIMHVAANRAGGEHDSFVFRVSTTGIALENGEAPENMWLLGNEAYAFLSSHCMTLHEWYYSMPIAILPMPC